MSWLRLDDGFAEHPKIQSVSERARWLHVTALCYCARHLTDGVLGPRDVKVLTAIVDNPCKKAINDLVRAELWVKLPQESFQIKDFLEWNPDAETTKRLRKERREAGSRGGKSPRKLRVEPNLEAVAKANAQAVASSTVLGPRPVPSRKEIPKAVTRPDLTASDNEIEQVRSIIDRSLREAS